MRAIIALLLSSMIFCCCAQKSVASVQPAIDLIVAGKDITRFPGYVLRIAKRDGNSIEGIRIKIKKGDGKETIITADKGTLMQGSDQTTVKFILFQAKTETTHQGKITRSTGEKIELEI